MKTRSYQSLISKMMSSCKYRDTSTIKNNQLSIDAELSYKYAETNTNENDHDSNSELSRVTAVVDEPLINNIETIQVSTTREYVLI